MESEETSSQGIIIKLKNFIVMLTQTTVVRWTYYFRYVTPFVTNIIFIQHEIDMQFDRTFITIEMSNYKSRQNILLIINCNHFCRYLSCLSM